MNSAWFSDISWEVGNLERIGLGPSMGSLEKNQNEEMSLEGVGMIDWECCGIRYH